MIYDASEIRKNYIEKYGEGISPYFFNYSNVDEFVFRTGNNSKLTLSPNDQVLTMYDVCFAIDKNHEIETGYFAKVQVGEDYYFEGFLSVVDEIDEKISNYDLNYNLRVFVNSYYSGEYVDFEFEIVFETEEDMLTGVLAFNA